MTLRWAEAQANSAEPKTQKEREIENYTRASGKMLLLHKLLPKLRAEGRQVGLLGTQAGQVDSQGLTGPHSKGLAGSRNGTKVVLKSALQPLLAQFVCRDATAGFHALG